MTFSRIPAENDTEYSVSFGTYYSDIGAGTAAHIHNDELFRGKRMLEYWLRRHYDPRSEQYTGADSLLTLLDLGWQPVEYVIREKVQLSGACGCCYHFQLQRPFLVSTDSDQTAETADTMLSLCIVYNPAVERVIAHLGLRVLAHEAVLDEVRAHFTGRG